MALCFATTPSVLIWAEPNNTSKGDHVNVATIFTTQGHTVSYKPGKMILPQAAVP